MNPLFASDNVTSACPEVMDALIEANLGIANSYGDDEWSSILKTTLSEVFETELEVYLAVTGTASNALSLSALAPVYGKIYCHELSHINTDECGAPELFTGGAKLNPMRSSNGRIKAKDLAEKYSSNAYNSIEELLDNEKGLDIVAVCSPNGLHASHSIKILNAGFNVLCEKPMAINLHDCGEMIKAAELNNKRLFAIKQNRFNPPVAAVKSAIDEGKLGKVYSIQLSCFWNRNEDYYANSWKGTKELDGGTLFTQFSQ